MSEGKSFNPVDKSMWLTPPAAARLIPGASEVSVRRWAEVGELKGAIQLPSGRWQIPWSAVVGILGFDPRSSEPTDVAPPPDDDRGEPLPGLGGQ